jgi:tetratricopeptide (TPR) repeat protein
MSGQQQLEEAHKPAKQHNPPLWVRWTIVLVALLLISGGAIFWLEETQGSFYTILPVVLFTVLGVLIGLFQWLFPVSSSGPDHAHPASHVSIVPEGAMAGASITQVPPIILHLLPAEQAASQSEPVDKMTYRGILGIPPPTDPRTIHQRENTVKDVYEKLTGPGLTALVLTGIGGVGKSTLAALVYRYAEEQRRAGKGLFIGAAIWLNIDSSVTFADLAGNLCEFYGKALPDFTSMALQHQAMALFNVLNSPDQPRLIILDQFENLLDWQTGRALPDRPGVGEWIDALNNLPCASRVLMTSRPWPRGTREYPATCMQEYPVSGLSIAEGIELLRKLHVEGSDDELRVLVEHCQGHAYALALFASLLRTRNLNASTFRHDTFYPEIWSGNVARNLLDYIYTRQLKEDQRRLLLAFSVYREPVHLTAAQALLDVVGQQPMSTAQVHAALDVLLNQHLLQAWGDDRYQLHAIVASYAQSHFVEGDELANRKALQDAHIRAANYYSQYATEHCPPRDKRRAMSDIKSYIEAAWHYEQAGQWSDAYTLIEREGVFPVLKRTGASAILLELYQVLLNGQWQPTPGQRARILNSLGVVYRTLGRLELARTYLEQAIQLYRQTNDRRGEAMALDDIGRVFAESGNRERARKDYEESLRICQEEGDQRGEGAALNNLGWVLVALGEDKQAKGYYEQSLSIFRDLGDRLGEAGVLNNLGRVYEDLGEFEQAHVYYQQALTIYRDERDRRGEAWSLNNLGKVYRKQGQPEEALKCLEQALQVRREIDRKGVGRTLKNIGTLYERLGQKQQALDYYRQSLQIAREVADREGEGKVMRNLGKLFLDQQHYEAAIAALLLSQSLLNDPESTYGDESQRGVDTLRATIGDERYRALLAKVEPNAAKIVEQALA